MKKITTWLSAALFSAILIACGGSGGSDATPSANNSSSSQTSSVSSSSSSSAVSSSSSSTSTASGITLHMLGDSTMTAYTEDRRPQMGWGEAMPKFFNSNVTIKNWALGGRSSRSFYYEATRWPAILPQINAGDYVIIQFGHNDQKYGGDYATYGTYAYCSDGSGDGEACSGAADAVETTVDKAEHSYYQFLKKYVTEVRAKGAYPILMTPIARKYFSGSTITAEGLHDWSAKTASGESSPRGSYPAAMKAVATKYNVPLVDLTSETKSIVESYGDAAATANLYITADSTHPQVLFANLIAKKATEGMAKLSVLKDYMVPVTSLIASPSTLAWSTRYVGISSTKTITVSAFDLTLAAGTVVVTSPSTNFELSFDQTTWSQSLNIDYTNSAFTKTVYVRFTPSAIQDYSSAVAFTLAGASVGSVAVSGTGVSAGSGMDSYATWFTAGSAVSAVTDGLITGADAVANNLTTTTSKVLAVNGQDTTVVRYTADTWTSHDSTKYLQFAATPAGTMSVNTISMYYATSGGSTIQADIEYSTDLTTWTRLNTAPLTSTKDVMTYVEYTGLAQSVATGQSIYIRIYPWNTAGNTGKSLALYGVKIAGKVSTGTSGKRH